MQMRCYIIMPVFVFFLHKQSTGSGDVGDIFHLHSLYLFESTLVVDVIPGGISI